jgi:hypothetical protein
MNGGIGAKGPVALPGCAKWSGSGIAIRAVFMRLGPLIRTSKYFPPIHQDHSIGWWGVASVFWDKRTMTR